MERWAPVAYNKLVVKYLRRLKDRLLLDVDRAKGDTGVLWELQKVPQVQPKEKEKLAFRLRPPCYVAAQL